MMKRLHIQSKETSINNLRTHDGKRLYPTAVPRRRALLVGAEIASLRSPWPVEDSLDELALLAKTADLEVVGRIFQRLSEPQPKFFIGPGKVKEVAALCEQTQADLIVFDEELSPAQTRNLEEELQTQVIDRTGLILSSTFLRATHVLTREGSRLNWRSTSTCCLVCAVNGHTSNDRPVRVGRLPVAW
jgi:GTP-binding protein HflX